MVDIDNVVKAIELCVSPISLSDITFNGEVEICPHSECPYFTTYGAGKCITAMCKDAADPLKAQEPVKPINENYWKHTMGRCGHCKAPLPAIEGLRSKYCWMCGKPVKWNG